jgi:hypothetical protein
MSTASDDVRAQPGWVKRRSSMPSALESGLPIASGEMCSSMIPGWRKRSPIQGLAGNSETEAISPCSGPVFLPGSVFQKICCIIRKERVKN